MIEFGDEIDLIRIAAYIDGNDNLSALTIDTDSNPYIWKQTINADEEFSVGFTEFFVPDGYFVPDDYAKIKRYENGSIDVTLKLRKNDSFELPPDTVRVTVYDKDTNELIPDEVLKNHEWSFGTSICTPTGYTGPFYLLEKNKQIFIGDLTYLYKTADSFDFLCDYQPEVQCYENHSMDLVFKIKIKVSGDINDDGVFNIADLISLDRFLLDMDERAPENWAESDYDLNNSLNAVDLCIMRKNLLEKFKEDESIKFTAKYDRSYSNFGIANPLFVHLNTNNTIDIYIEEGSGSITHKVTGVSKNKVYIDRYFPLVQTCDMAYWKITVNVDNNAELSDDIQVEFNDIYEMFY